MNVTMQIDIPARRIADIMVTAMEHNDMTRSWVAAVRLRSPTEDDIYMRTKNHNWYDVPELWAGEFEIDVWEISDEGVYPGSFDPEGNYDAKLDELGLTKHTIRKADLDAGIKLMAEKHPSSFGDWMTENDDAITADVFLQCVVLKDVIYG